MSEAIELLVWKAATRSLGLAEAMPGLAAAIARGIPHERIWIFALDRDRWTLAAAWSRDAVRTAPFELRGDRAAAVARFAARGAVARLDPSRPGTSLVAPLAPAFAGRPVVCGGLRRGEEAEGIVAIEPGAGGLDARGERMLSSFLEPLAVALEHHLRVEELDALRRAAEAAGRSALQRLGRTSLDEPIVGAAGGLKAVLERVELVARSDLPALILGETGSGKEVIARAIHERSARHAGPFLRVNCGAIPPELVDSELFGHEKGAFTGANERRKGWFERADGGTLFLDEIGELPLAAQVRLLRVTQDGTLERVGGHETVRVDCRIVAATHRDLAGMVRERTFREDLWYRLAVFPVFLPPLRERTGDLGPLASLFAIRAASRFGLSAVAVQDEDLALLASYGWPGNVRELQAVIDRATLLGGGKRLAIAAAMGLAERGPTRADAGTPGRPDPAAAPVTTLDEAVRRHVQRALEACGGRIEGPRGAARLLGINPHTLRSRMRRLGIEWARFRDASAWP